MTQKVFDGVIHTYLLSCYLLWASAATCSSNSLSLMHFLQTVGVSLPKLKIAGKQWLIRDKCQEFVYSSFLNVSFGHFVPIWFVKSRRYLGRVLKSLGPSSDRQPLQMFLCLMFTSLRWHL